MRIVGVINNVRVDFTDYLVYVEWHGDKSQVARTLEFSVAFKPDDYYIQKVDLLVGDEIYFYSDSEEEVFRGHIHKRSLDHEGDGVQYVAYDDGIYLVKNTDYYKFRGVTAEAMTNQICSDFDIPIGQIEPTGIIQNRIFSGDTLYSMVMKAYSKARTVTGKEYFAVMVGGKFNILEKGRLIANFACDGNYNLQSSSYEESIENMINRIRVYDSSGTLLQTISDEDMRSKYGTFQSVIQSDKMIADVNDYGESQLQGMEQSGSISIAGDMRCVTGYSVLVADEVTGLVGRFYIDSDYHSWVNGEYTTRLQLSFKNLMDLQAIQEETDTDSSDSSGSSSNLVWNFAW